MSDFSDADAVGNDGLANRPGNRRILARSHFGGVVDLCRGAEAARRFASEISSRLILVLIFSSRWAASGWPWAAASVYCAPAFPWSAARRYHLMASSMSLGTPRPAS